jgi:hypothetical protein
MFSVWSVRRLYNEWQLSSQPVLVWASMKTEARTEVN